MLRSVYYSSLSGDIKARYDKKIEIIDNIDPYTLSDNELLFNVKELPNVTIMDLVNYLILSHSYYTGEQLKAYKSLQAYKYYESGFVCQVLAKQANDAFLVCAKVRHSQRSNEKPLRVWIIILKDGSISTGHCTCMAGLGEVCSHIAAVLFYLNARPDDLACTERLASWPVPSTRNVDMVRIRDMDWCKETKIVPLQGQQRVPVMERNEVVDLLKKLEDIQISSAICRLVEPFASNTVRTDQTNLPNSLDCLYDGDFTSKTHLELLEMSKNIDMALSEEDAKLIEKATREQSYCDIWFKYRTGRITASRFKSVCRTSLEKPSLTVIKGICYPLKVKFHSKQTDYGMKNEKTALKAYEDIARNQHRNFTLTNSGFFISLKHPELGASPDGLICCDCCGSGCVEVKCPYLLSGNLTFEEFVNKKYSCLISNNGKVELDKKHCYFYQVQLQMFVTERKFCDFILWSRTRIFIERIFIDEVFCLENIRKALDFHNNIIKPELLAKYFTQKMGMGKLKLWCVCHKPDDNRPMLKCENDNCDIQWYHFDCVNISEVPDTYWFCESCK